MNWKILLKEIRMDKDVNCCEEARMKIVEWFEEQAEVVSSIKNFQKGLENMSVEYSEYPCEELYEKITSYMHNVTEEEEQFLDIELLREIVDDWDKCKKEPMKEKSPKKEYDWYKQTGDDTTAWMDKYFATGRA